MTSKVKILRVYKKVIEKDLEIPIFLNPKVYLTKAMGLREVYAITRDNNLVCLVESNSPADAMGLMTGHLCNSIIDELGEDSMAVDDELVKRFGKYDYYKQYKMLLNTDNLNYLRKHTKLSEFEPFFVKNEP